MPKRDQLIERLSEFVPENTAPELVDLIIHHHVHFKISRPRQTKLGDYRPPTPRHGHRISVNGDLNPYQFYLTALHEFAHLIAFEKYGTRIAPHGKEWKSTFGELLRRALGRHTFPQDIEQELQRYLQKPSASSCVDHDLVRVLLNYDEHQGMLLEDLPAKARFQVGRNPRIFLKGEKLRKRYRCLDEGNQKMYLISAIAEVVPVE